MPGATMVSNDPTRSLVLWRPSDPNSGWEGSPRASDHGHRVDGSSLQDTLPYRKL